MTKVRVEFVYNKIKNITEIYIWKNQRIEDIKTVDGGLTSIEQKKKKKDILKEYK